MSSANFYALVEEYKEKASSDSLTIEDAKFLVGVLEILVLAVTVVAPTVDRVTAARVSKKLKSFKGE